MAREFKMAFNSLPPSLISSSSFILPEPIRPNLEEEVSGQQTVSIIPVIDLQELDQSLLVGRVSEACQSFGFFQVINHGIELELCDRVLDTATQFFELPPEDKKEYVTTDHKKKVKIFNYYYTDEQGHKFNMWAETFTLPWSPVDQAQFLPLVPQNPPQYREVYGRYAREMGRLMDRVLGLMSLGLGLEEGALKRSLGPPELYSQANYYPPCPQPELTMGLGAHTDIVAIAVLLQTQGAPGLQIMKDGQWLFLHPIPNSFVVNVADQIQVLSNGIYKSVVHRAVTNSTMKRVSMVMFYAPHDDTEIKPIEKLTHKDHRPPKYTNFSYREFMQKFHSLEGTGRRRVKEAFELPNSP